MKKIYYPLMVTSFIFMIFLLGTDNLVIGPLLNQIAKDNSTTISKVSLGITLYSVAYGVFAILLAPVSDIIGRKIVVVVSTVLFGLTCIAIYLFHNNEAFLTFRFFSGVFAAALGPNLWAYSNESFEAGKRELVVSWMMSAFNLSTVLGIPLGLLLGGIMGWSRIFLFIGFISFIMAAVFLIFGKQTQIPSAFNFKKHFSNIGKAIHLNWRLALSMLFSSAAYLCVYPFISYWLSSVNKWVDSEVSVAFLVIGLTGLTGNILSGILLQKYSPVKLAKFSWISQLAIIIVILAGLLLFNNAIVFMTSLSLWTFMTGLGNTSFISFVASRGGAIRGSVMAVNNSSIFLGFTFGSYFGSIIWGIKNSLVINTGISVVISMCALLFLVLEDKKLRNCEQKENPNFGV